jgi:hypothetical protein
MFSTDFSFQNLVFVIYLNFQWQNTIQYLPPSWVQILQIYSIKSCFLRTFEQYQKKFSIPLKISSMI